MASSRSWEAFPPTYCAREMKTLADWVLAGVSGSVVGPAGAGKSNLLGFACHRPEVLQTYLPSQACPAMLLCVDLNNLPSNDLATLYRVLLRAFYKARDRFDQAQGQLINDLYQSLRQWASQDPFLSQGALHEVLQECQTRDMRVVLVLDSFDRFCQTATPQMLNALRGLRDSFKDTLCYIVGTRQEVIYLFDPADLGEMCELLDTHVCWVGPLNEDDALYLVAKEMQAASIPPTETEAMHLISLTGGYPALLKAACHWWLDTSHKPPISAWRDALLAERSIHSRLREIWAGLSQEERGALFEVREWQSHSLAPAAAEARPVGEKSQEGDGVHVLDRLAAKGLCRRTDGGWSIFCDLFAAYVADAGGTGGKIWLDEETGEWHRGPTPLEDLTSLERTVLHFLVRHPRVRHAKTDLIINTWPEDLRRHGVTDESLYQVIRELRKKIEPDPGNPCYIVTWRGRPEGGYQFFPEGKPG
jgi:hypothetical protein